MSERKSYVISDNHFLDLNVYHIGREACSPLLMSGPAKRNNFLYHNILSGKGIFQYINDKGQGINIPLRAGDGFLIWPNQEYSYWADGETPWEYTWIEFNGFKAKELILRTGLSFNDPVYHAKNISGQDIVKDAILAILENAEQSSIALMGYFYLFINALIASSSKRKEFINTTLKDFYTHEAVAYIERHYHEKITVQNIADYCRLDRSYLSKVFKSIMSVSLQEFLMLYRIKKACDILQTTNLPVGEVCVLVGYLNMFNFSRAFKTVNGLSPSKWRTANKLK